MAVDYVEDPIVHIVKVTVGRAVGAVCVFAQQFLIPVAFESRVYAGKPATDKPQDWQQTYVFPSWAHAQAYALAKPADKDTPVFLIGGGSQTPGVTAPIANIYYSNDGENWSIALATSMTSGAGWCGFTWHPDDKLWYAIFDGSDNNATIYSSPDGRAWSAGESFSGGDYEDAAEPAFRALCTKPANKGGIPDGWQGYDPDKKIFIKPTAIIGWTLGGPDIDYDADGITIEKEGGGGGGELPPGGGGVPPNVVAVSFAGGVWNLLTWDYKTPNPSAEQRPARVYASTDDGASWQQVFEATGWVYAGLSSGAASDIAAFAAGGEG
ncbi:MAG TPA: hypothetical protein VJ890_21170 [Vineibacter sp.]|nr:hypothetical protein [Vineibacter sp.]